MHVQLTNYVVIRLYDGHFDPRVVTWIAFHVKIDKLYNKA